MHVPEYSEIVGLDIKTILGCVPAQIGPLLGLAQVASTGTTEHTRSS
jgi:hypothetical protein